MTLQVLTCFCCELIADSLSGIALRNRALVHNAARIGSTLGGFGRSAESNIGRRHEDLIFYLDCLYHKGYI